MKGYVVKNGKVVMVEKKNGRVVGSLTLANGTEADINIFTGQARLIHLNIASRILDAFSYAIKDVNRPLRIGHFGIWFENGWNFTDWSEVPAWLQENE